MSWWRSVVIAILYGMYRLYSTSTSSLSFEDSEKSLKSESLDMLFCLKNLGSTRESGGNRAYQNNNTTSRDEIAQHRLVPVSWPFLDKNWAVFSAKNVTKFLLGRTLTFSVDLFTYWTVKLYQKIHFICTSKKILKLSSLMAKYVWELFYGNF